MANVWPATQSQLYGELNKLADAGLIEVSDIGPRGRKEYRDHRGRPRRTAAVDDNPADDPPFRSPELLRVFLLGEIPADQARKHLLAVAEHADGELARLRRLNDSIAWGDADAEFFGRAALEYGLRAEAHGGAVGPLVARGHRPPPEIIVASR